MKIKDGFILRKIGTDNVVLATRSAMMLLNGIIQLNETGALLWEQISSTCATKEQLADFLCKRYNLSIEQAMADVDDFLAILRKAKCIEE